MPGVLTSPSVERVREALARAGVSDTIVELPGAARTARAAADFLGCEIGQIANSLVFRAGVPPVGHSPARTFVEKSLAAYRELWAAAGHPHTVFRLTYAELVRITGGAEVELA